METFISGVLMICENTQGNQLFYLVSYIIILKLYEQVTSLVGVVGSEYIYLNHIHTSSLLLVTDYYRLLLIIIDFCYSIIIKKLFFSVTSISIDCHYKSIIDDNQHIITIEID